MKRNAKSRGTRAARLRELGLTYREYLLSDHWQDFRRRYFKSGLPRRCLGCNEARVQLHHRTYQRIGRERLTDVVPLCQVCHNKVHDYERTHPTHLAATHAILRRLFGWSKAQMKAKFDPYRLPGRPNGFSLSPLPMPKAKRPPVVPAPPSIVSTPEVPGSLPPF